MSDQDISSINQNSIWNELNIEFSFRINIGQLLNMINIELMFSLLFFFIY